MNKIRLLITIAFITCAYTLAVAIPTHDTIGDPTALNIQEYPLSEYVQAGICKRLPSLIATYAGHSGIVCTLNYNNDGSLLASGSEDTTVKLWDTKTGNCIKTLYGHDEPVTLVKFSPNGNYLATVSENNIVKLWNIASGVCTLNLDASYVRSLAWSPDGNLLATGHGAGIDLWDTQTGTCLKTLLDPGKTVESLAFCPTGNIIASGAEKETIKLWHIETGACLHSMKTHPEDLLPNGKPRLYEGRPRFLVDVKHVTFDATGSTLTSVSADGLIQTWDSTTGICLHAVRMHNRSVWNIAFNPNATLAASTGHDNRLSIWNGKTGAAKQSLNQRFAKIQTVTFHPNDGTIALTTYTNFHIDILKIDYTNVLLSLSLSSEIHKFIYQAAHDWHNNQPHKVDATHEIYRATLNALPFLHDHRLFLTQ